MRGRFKLDNPITLRPGPRHSRTARALVPSNPTALALKFSGYA